jgi:hypothetical protein
MRHAGEPGIRKFVWGSGGLLCALGGILATVGFFLPWFSSRVIGMPEQTVEISIWSGWATTFPVGLPIVMFSVVVGIIGLASLPNRQGWPMVALALGSAGLLTLLVVTLLLFQDDLPSGPPPQMEVGLPLTYLGYGVILAGCFVMKAERLYKPPQTA